MIALARCAFCERPGTLRDPEKLYVCSEHRASLRWRTMMSPASTEATIDPILDLIGREAMLGR
jgi:hypothetical protein